MTISLCNNNNNNIAADAVSNNNNGNNNNNSNNNNSNAATSGTESAVTPINTSGRPSSSGASSAPPEHGRWKTVLIPAGTAGCAATLPRPKRDFRLKVIELEQSPKWFVWPQRNKKNKWSSGGGKTDSDASSSSSGNNNASRPDTPIPGAAGNANRPALGTAVAQSAANNNNNIEKLMNEHKSVNRTKSSPLESNNNGALPRMQHVLQRTGTITTIIPSTAKNNDKQNGEHRQSNAISSPLDIKGARANQQQHHEIMIQHFPTMMSSAASSSTQPMNMSSSEPSTSSFTMYRRAATVADHGQHISGSAPTTSGKFKILSISKKIYESNDEDDLDLANCVILNCRHSQPVILSPTATTATNTVKEVH